MVIYDVPPSRLIEAMARDLRENLKAEAPAFTRFVKTGAHAERAPSRRDWYHVRMASILYRVFKNGRTGVGALRSYYGGRKNRGVRPHKHVKAGGKIIRTALQQLEALGFVQKDEQKGRVVAPKGHAFLARHARALKENPDAFAVKKKARAAPKLFAGAKAASDAKTPPLRGQRGQGRKSARHQKTSKKR